MVGGGTCEGMNSAVSSALLASRKAHSSRRLSLQKAIVAAKMERDGLVLSQGLCFPVVGLPIIYLQLEGKHAVKNKPTIQLLSKSNKGIESLFSWIILLFV